MGGSSTGEPIYQCGTHDYETKNLKEFNEHDMHIEAVPIMTELKINEYAGSKGCSASVPVNKLQEILRFQRSNGRL